MIVRRIQDLDRFFKSRSFVLNTPGVRSDRLKDGRVRIHAKGKAAAAIAAAGPGPPEPITINMPLGVFASENLLLVTQWQDQHLLSLDVAGNAVALALLPMPSSGTPAERHYPSIAPAQAAGAGFTPGDIFVTQENSIYKVIGSAVSSFATVSGGSILGGITFDHVGSFGYKMIVVSEDGLVWQISGAGGVANIASLGTRLESPAVAPVSFGTWAGQILAADGSAGQVHAIASDGTVTTDIFDFGGVVAIAVIPDSLSTFLSSGGAFWQTVFNMNYIQPYPPSSFSGLSGILLSSEAGYGMLSVGWNGSGYDINFFDSGVTAAQFEGSAFVDAAINATIISAVASSAGVGAAHAFGGAVLSGVASAIGTSEAAAESGP